MIFSIFVHHGQDAFFICPFLFVSCLFSSNVLYDNTVTKSFEFSHKLVLASSADFVIMRLTFWKLEVVPVFLTIFENASTEGGN